MKPWTRCWMILAVIGSQGQLAAQQVTEDKLRSAVENAISLLETASAGSAEQRMCFSCHGQALPVMALTEAAARGFEIDRANLQRQLDHTSSFLKRGRKNYLSGKGQGGRVDTAGYALWTLEAEGRVRPEITDPVIGYLLSAVSASGGWTHSSHRPPSEASDFTTTYLALRGLAAFGDTDQSAVIAKRTEAAGQWLLEKRPADTEDRVFQLRGLYYAGADEKAMLRASEPLIADQRDDGGWAQRTGMDSDAYATGTVLVALARTGQLEPTSESYRRGLALLLRTQHDDGSWHVVSRSEPFQKYFETGFPHGKDQFISTTATAWSTIAMLLALPDQIDSER